jgi:hypothetical protein
MKNTNFLRLLGTIALAMVIAFSMTACGGEDDGPVDENNPDLTGPGGVGDNFGGRIAYSSDGINWTMVPGTIFPGYVRWVVWGGDKFIAVRNFRSLTIEDGIASSSDGVNWSVERNNIFEKTHGVNGIAWGNGMYVATGNDSRMAYSRDGLTWTDVEDTAFGTRRINGIAWGEDRFIAIGGSNNQFYKTSYSADGITWTLGPGKFSNNGTLAVIAWGDGTWVAPGNWTDINYSRDGGTTWKQVYATPTTLGGSIQDVAWGNGKFVAVGGDRIAYSPDGETWTVKKENIFGSDNITRVVWGNDKFVATSYGGMIAYSADGVTWTGVTNLTALGNIWDLTWGNGKFVAVGMGY